MDNFAEVIRSPEFHFLVGHDGRRLTIHAGLVQKLSRPLEALINNGCMKKSLSQTAVMDDVEEETFIAFCDFGYRGKYTTPCRKDKDSEDHLAAAGEDQSKRPAYYIFTKFSNPQSRSDANERVFNSEPQSEPQAELTEDWEGCTSKKNRKKKKPYYSSSPPEWTTMVKALMNAGGIGLDLSGLLETSPGFLPNRIFLLTQRHMYLRLGILLTH